MFHFKGQKNDNGRMYKKQSKTTICKIYYNKQTKINEYYTMKNLNLI